MNLIVRIGNKGEGSQMFPEYKNAKMGTVKACGILEGGMQSGEASVAIVVQSENWELIIAETSAALLEGMASALQGAKERFAINARKRN